MRYPPTTSDIRDGFAWLCGHGEEDGYDETRAEAFDHWLAQRDDVIRELIAQEIRGDLVCCDVYERLSGIPAEMRTIEQAMESRRHSICYWGEAAARLAEEGGYDETRAEAFDHWLAQYRKQVAGEIAAAIPHVGECVFPDEACSCRCAELRDIAHEIGR